MNDKCIADDAEEIQKGDLDIVNTCFVGPRRFLNDPQQEGEIKSFIVEKINSCAVPTCSILVKDHKNDGQADANGDYPVCFVVPDYNFMSSFANVGY